METKSKMKFLATNQCLLVWLCFCADNECHSKWKRLARITFSLVVFIFSVSCFPASVAYVSKFRRTNLEESLFALFQVAASVGCIYFAVHAYYFRYRFAKLFQTLSNICAECKWIPNVIRMCCRQPWRRNSFSILDANERSFHFLTSANSRGGWICKTYYKTMGTISCASILTSIVSVWICYKNYGQFDARYAMHADRVM